MNCPFSIAILAVLAGASVGCSKPTKPAAVCDVHGEVMAEYTLPVNYGYLAIDFADRAELFPNCGVINSRLCVPIEGEEFATVNVCEKCDEARASFLAKLREEMRILSQTDSVE